MPFADLEDARLHYVLEGPEGAPVLALSNSLGTDLHLWDAQAPALAREFRLLRYDTRGHGQSTGEGVEYTLDGLGADVLHLLDFLRIERFHVCGISLGGIAALWLAIHAPMRVLSVMLCNTAARIGNESGWNARIEQVTAHGMASIAEATMERWFTAGFRERCPAQVEAMRQMLVQTDATAYAACCAALRDADLRDAVSSIAAPALIISSTHDPATSAAEGRWLHGSIPGSTYRELNASHISNVEAADEFLSAMLEFLLLPGTELQG